MSEVRFRPATADDCRLIFEWANDRETRANSASTRRISWDDHVPWYERKLADPNSEIWIAVDERDEPLGQVRFDIGGDEAEIGVSVAPGRRGEGLGSRLIEQATRDFAARQPGVAVVANVRPHNLASQKAFLKSGYVPDGQARVRGVDMLRFVRPAG